MQDRRMKDQWETKYSVSQKHPDILAVTPESIVGFS